MIDIHKIKGYSGYGVEVSLKYKDSDEIHTALLDTEIAGICKCYNLGMDYLIDFEVEYYKLHLRSIEDLTDEECTNMKNWEYIFKDMTKEEVICTIQSGDVTDELSRGIVEYFHENHIDYQDLIGQGLAIKKEVE